VSGEGTNVPKQRQPGAGADREVIEHRVWRDRAMPSAQEFMSDLFPNLSVVQPRSGFTSLPLFFRYTTTSSSKAWAATIKAISLSTVGCFRRISRRYSAIPFLSPIVRISVPYFLRNCSLVYLTTTSVKAKNRICFHECPNGRCHRTRRPGYIRLKKISYSQLNGDVAKSRV